jgi:ABC-type nitrate/sulfonate/bicarbonate transport system substrate-binding protein
MATLKRRSLIVLVVVILVIAIVLSSFVYLNSQKPFNGKVESITVGTSPSAFDTLIYVALDQQYFAVNGLDVTIENYPNGFAAAQGMLNGQVNIATSSDFVIAEEAVANVSLYAIGSLCKYNNIEVIARTDLGITNISDLVGKKIGVLLGQSTQFYFAQFLEQNGISQNQLTIVNTPNQQLPMALANGTVDAIVTTPPYTSQAQSLLPNDTVTWSAQNNQFSYLEAVCSRSWAAANPDLIVRFLKALVEAQNFNINHPAQTMALVEKQLNVTSSSLASIWGGFQFSVTLTQPLILLMQNEAQWLISNNLTTATQVPNFINYIYVNGLETVNPNYVNVIG